jgi:hypothetical protein
MSRARESLCENYQQPLPSVTAQYLRSSKITALPVNADGFHTDS